MPRRLFCCRIASRSVVILVTMSEADLELLARYTRQNAEDAFAEIVRRHVDLVYSAALRQVRSPQLAEEIVQSAFLKLARHARELAPNTVVAAWLYEVTRRAAIDVVRREARRQLREQIACEMNSMNALSADWPQIEPLLDEAMHSLDETDRTAVLLRYFENKSLREVGQTLGTSDDAAQKRVSRAVERLREFFAKRGVTVGASGLAIVISANAVQAAPMELAFSISTAAALSGTGLQTSTVIAASKTIIMTTLQKTIVAATLVVAASTGIYEAREASNLRSRTRTIQQQQTDQIQQLHQERDEALGKLTAATEELDRLRQDLREMVKLRGEVTRLRSQAQPTAQLKPSNASDPVESTALTWVNRVAHLKQRLEQVPDVRIPEIQLLDEEDWLVVVKGRPLETEIDYRRALSALRTAGG